MYSFHTVIGPPNMEEHNSKVSCVNLSGWLTNKGTYVPNSVVEEKWKITLINLESVCWARQGLGVFIHCASVEAL